MIVFPPEDGVCFIKNVMIPMSDGVHLALDMHVPEDENWERQPQPLILEYIPYRKDDVAAYSGQHHYFARHGFIGARLDCRGTGASEGVNTDEYTEREQQDAVEAIEWLAQQSWCNGQIGMTGGSYGGVTCVQVAAHRPPALKTIIPIYFTDDRYTDDCHYRGGAWRCYYDIGAYGISMVGMNAMPPYPEYSGAEWARTWEEHLEHNTPYILNWLAQQKDGPYWRPGSLQGRYGQVECPVFMIGGWRDGYPNSPLRTFENLQVPSKLLMGPWNHSRPNVALPGPRIDYLHEIVRWCDYWLKGEENGVMDEEPICFYMQTYDEPRADRTQTSGYWRTEKDLRAPGSAELIYALGPAGQLIPEGIGAATFDEYEYRPTVGIAGGLWSGGVPFGLPTDQRVDEIHSLNYTSAPLEEPLEIFGRPRVLLHASSTAPVMAFVARLCDVAEDGSSALICTGVLNATRRDSLSQPTALEPGKVYELEVELDATGWRFAAGHCIRLSICSADFPNLWPTPYRGANRIGHASQLVLPLLQSRPATTGELPRDEADFRAGNEVEVYDLGPHEPPWEIVQDVLGDRTGLNTRERNVVRVSTDMEIENQRQLEVWASNRDPADVVATSQHVRRIVRRDGTTSVDTRCTLKSTVEAFHLSIDLSIKIGALPHHQQRWTQSFPRELL